MEGVKHPTFKINPRFRLTTKHLSVQWFKVDNYTLHCEASIAMPGRRVFSTKSGIQLLSQFHEGHLDLIYCDETDFESSKVQKWLRELLRDTILQVARTVLPERVKYWEQKTGLHGNGVTVKRLRSNIMGQCSFRNHISLQPFLVIFRQDWMDGVILHEMAHYKHKHHRKPFWDFLSTLVGEDSKKMEAKNDISLSPYYEYYLYLTKN